VPTILQRLAGFFPSFLRGGPTASAADARLDIIAATQKQLRETVRREEPSTEEKTPRNYAAGIAGKVWFLPYLDSATRDTSEIRAAMRSMFKDPYVKCAWEPQLLTVASEDYQVQAAEPGNTESEEQASFCKAVIDEHIAGGMPGLVRNICAPLGSDGFSLAEKVRDVVTHGRYQNYVTCRAVKARDASIEQIRLEGDAYGNVLSVKSMRAKAQQTYPIEDFIYSKYMTVFDEPMGNAAFRSSYSAFWMRDTVRKLRIIHHEKKMAGFLVGEYEDPADKGPLEDALRRAKSATWAAVPMGTKINAVQLSTASEPDYKSFDESLRDEIVQGIALATLQTLQGNIPDARGDSKVQKATADLGPWYLMVLVQEAVNKQLFPELVDFNFPYPAGGGYPRLTFGAVSNQELLELVSLVQSYQSLGFDLSKKHYAKALSVQVADENDPEDKLGGQPAMGGDQQGQQPPAGAMGGMPAGDPYAGETPFAGSPDGSAMPFGQEGDGTQVFAEQGGPGGVGAGHGLIHTFAWTDWKPAGELMVSPGGRKLKRETWERMKAASKAKVKAVQGQTPASPPPAATSNNPVGLAMAPGAPPPRSGAGAGPGRTVVSANPRPALPPNPMPPADPAIGAAVVAAGIQRRVARGARKATAFTAGRIAKLQALGGRGLAITGRMLSAAARELGHWVSHVPLVGFLGRAVEGIGRRNAIRFETVNRAFRRGVGAGNKAFAREIVRGALGVKWKESRRKYGAVLATAIEGAMLGWTFGKGALIGGLGTMALGGGGAAAGAAAAGAQFALDALDTYMDNMVKAGSKGVGMSLTGYVRQGLEGTARRVSNLATGHEPLHRNAGAPGRVAMALEWAEGLNPRKFRRALGGKGTFSLGYVGGDRRATLSGRGGSITRQAAAQWLVKKRELEAADAEGREPKLSPEDVGVLRKAIQISLEGRAVGGGMVAGTPQAVAGARAAVRERTGVLDLDRRGRVVGVGRRFAEGDDGGDGVAALPYVPPDLIVDFREDVDDLRDAVGLPPVGATDDELAGSLAVALAMMEQKWEKYGGGAGGLAV
jgi:hypothetical protein